MRDTIAPIYSGQALICNWDFKKTCKPLIGRSMIYVMEPIQSVVAKSPENAGKKNDHISACKENNLD